VGFHSWILVISMQPDYVIYTENLTKQYANGVYALRGVTLEIEKGDCVGYLGPNGSGKTTTLKILTNLIRPTSGHTYIKGIDVNREPERALRYIGALIEVPGMYDYLTPHDMLSYQGAVCGMNKKAIKNRIETILSQVKLSDWEYAKIRSFSTGMVRRLVIASAMFHNPEILILDEPVLGLDPSGMKDIRDVIKRLQRSEKTILISSHLLYEVNEICDRVIFLDKGKVLAYDTIDKLRKRTHFRRIQIEFLKPLTKEDVEKIRAIDKVINIDVKKSSVKIRYKGKPDTSAKILKELFVNGFDIISYTPESASLEDVYASIFGKDTEVA